MAAAAEAAASASAAADDAMLRRHVRIVLREAPGQKAPASPAAALNAAEVDPHILAASRAHLCLEASDAFAHSQHIGRSHGAHLAAVWPAEDTRKMFCMLSRPTSPEASTIAPVCGVCRAAQAPPRPRAPAAGC